MRTSLRRGPLINLDRRALILARTKCHTPALERAARRYSRLGEHGACWLALGALGTMLDADPARRVAWRRGTTAVLAAYGLNYAVKLAVRRRRPELPGLPPLTPVVSRLSFPSAHATTSFAAARAYSKVAPAAPLYAAAIVFGMTRPYLGVHYPSDVLGGVVLGTAIAEVIS
jgi:undecaprenyl-diphosphatase